MAQRTYTLSTVTRVLDDGLDVVEVLGAPEISVLGESEVRASAILRLRVGRALSDWKASPSMHWHRRVRVTGRVETREVEIEFEPAEAKATWRAPVRVRVLYVVWREGEALAGWVSALQLEVVARDEDELRRRVEQHVRLYYSSRDGVKLWDLVQLGRTEAVRVGSVEVVVTRESARQTAESDGKSSKDGWVVGSMCDEWPRRGSAARSGDGRRVGHEIEEEVRELAERFRRGVRSNVLLVGPPGSGKTTVAKEFARRRHEFGMGETPFWWTEAARLMSGSGMEASWQDRCLAFCREARRVGAIVHLGELWPYLDLGKALGSSMSVGQFLRPWLSRGEVVAIAECTMEQWGALARRAPDLVGAFQTLTIRERTPEETRRILDRVIEESGINAEGDAARALDRLHRLHLRYATYSSRPGRPIRFLRSLVTVGDGISGGLSESKVIQCFSEETGMPRAFLDDAERLDLREAEAWFGRRVVGQPEAVRCAVDAVATIKARLGRPRRPLASLMFVGPTGTGKTELAKALAEFLFGDGGRMIRFDLNEYGQPGAVQRLIGGGLSGEREGLLTARVREQPFRVVLFDEFEKAEPGFYDLLLQILGDGRLSDSEGRVADFCNCVVVMTSNLGAAEYGRGRVGFGEATGASEAREHFVEAVQKFLRPEAFNRIDAIVPFMPLSRESIRGIARRNLEALKGRDGIRLAGVTWEYTEAVTEHLAEVGYDVRYGVRPLKRAMEREVVAPLAAALNEYSAAIPLEARADVMGGRISISATPVTRRDAAEAGMARAESAGMETAVRVRRWADRLARCPVAARLRDELELLRLHERRLAKARTGRGMEPSRRARMGELGRFLERLDAGAEWARRHELERLGRFYSTDAGRWKELDASDNEAALIEAAYRENRMLAYRMQFKDPDTVVIGVYADSTFMTAFCSILYHQLACELGRIRAMDYVVSCDGEAGSHRKVKLRRESRLEPHAAIRDWPEGVVGVVMEVSGDLIRARLGHEAGLHLYKWAEREGGDAWCVEIGGRFPEYLPAMGAVSGTDLRQANLPVRRTYVDTKRRAKDSVLGERFLEDSREHSQMGNERSADENANLWLGLVRRMVEERLECEMEAMVLGRGGEGER